MNIFLRHKKSTFLLAIHLAWWLFLFYFFWVKAHTNHIDRPHCDFSPLMFFYSIPIAIGGSLILLGKHIGSKGNSNDFLLFAGLSLFPLIIAAGIYCLSNTSKKATKIAQIIPTKPALKTCRSQQKNDHSAILYRKANHKLGYWVHKRL